MFPFRPALSVLLVALATPLAANDFEAGLSIGAGTPTRNNVDLATGTLVAGTGTAIRTQFSGPWKLAGLDLAYEVARTEQMKYWVRAGYTTALGSADYAKTGENSPVALSYQSESVNGTLTYSYLSYGLGLSFVTNRLGEYGLSLDRRNHNTQLTGTATHVSPALAITTSSYALTAKASDFLVTLSMSFVQEHPTFKTYQRISYAVALGGPSGEVASWTLGPAYLDRTHATQELRVGYGFRF